MGRTRNVPTSLVWTSRLTPVAMFLTVMAAPTIFPPLGSATSPTIVALLVWAYRAGINTKTPVAIRPMNRTVLRDWLVEVPVSPLR